MDETALPVKLAKLDSLLFDQLPVKLGKHTFAAKPLAGVLDNSPSYVSEDTRECVRVRMRGMSSGPLDCHLKSV